MLRQLASIYLQFCEILLHFETDQGDYFHFKTRLKQTYCDKLTRANAFLSKLDFKMLICFVFDWEQIILGKLKTIPTNQNFEHL